MKNSLLLVTAVHAGLLMNCQLSATSWDEIFQEKQHLFDQHPECARIKEQQICFAKKEAPAIAHPSIKAIPIVENRQELIDVRYCPHSHITMMPDPAQPFESDSCNSGLPTASKMRADVYNRLVNMTEYLDLFAPEFGYKPGQISIRLFEGLRDLETQAKLFGNKKSEIMAANPEMTEGQAEVETAKWVSPVKNNVPVHSTGAAIDIRLWNETTQDFLDLGKFGVIWGPNPSAPTFSEEASYEQKLNRLYLLVAASKAGLVNYVFEYWHLSAGDRYAQYWQEKDAEKRVAVYNSVQ